MELQNNYTNEAQSKALIAAVVSAAGQKKKLIKKTRL